jgi:hypothetical protein
MRMSVLPHRSDKTEPQSAGAPFSAAREVVASARFRIAERIAKLADETAKETNRNGERRSGEQVGLARAVEIRRENVLPEIEARLRQIRSTRATSSSAITAPTCSSCMSACSIPPSSSCSSSRRRIRCRSRPSPFAATIARTADYRPSPYRSRQWMIAAIDYDLTRLTFVDHGAGKGRVLLVASQYPFQAIGGVEFAEELQDDATMNIAQFPRSRMKCRNVECVLDDAAALGPPEGESVHYFFNPFSREVFAEVLDNIVVSYRGGPPSLYLVLVDPVGTDLIDQSGVFQRHACRRSSASR